MTRTRAISFDRVAPIYEATRRRPPEIERHVSRTLAGILRGGRCLDVGVGTGRIAGPILEAERIDLVGIDVAPRMLARARSHGVRSLARADARSLPFRDRSMTTHLLHLVEEWPRVLGEIARVTEREYLSVIEHERAVPDLMEEYRRGAEAAGLRGAPPGLAERTLAERLPPPTGGRRPRRELSSSPPVRRSLRWPDAPSGTRGRCPWTSIRNWCAGSSGGSRTPRSR